MNVKKLIKLGACREAVSWAEEQADDTSAWIACERGDWMLWLLGKLSGPAWGERRKLLVLAACECARLALPYTHDKQIETCIETVEAWTRGEATQTQVRNAYDAAAAAATNAAAATARSRTLHLCADIVRKHYPNPPIL